MTNKKVPTVTIPISHYDGLNKRIAELEEMVSVLAIADETGYVDGYGFIVDFNKITDEARKFLAAHNLEQQVKSLSEFSESLLFRGCLENNFERNDVLERIKEIKGGAK
jgi:hypothetical protein